VIAEARVGPRLTVLSPVLLDQDPGLLWSVKPLAIEALVPEPAVEALAHHVLPGSARVDTDGHSYRTATSSSCCAQSGDQAPCGWQFQQPLTDVVNAGLFCDTGEILRFPRHSQWPGFQDEAPPALIQ
jgi:hypothetical protein